MRGSWLLAVIVSVLAGCAGVGEVADGDAADRASNGEQTDAQRRGRVRLELASAYFAQGQLDTALNEVKLALAANPAMSEAFSLRGLIHASLGDDARADESFRRARQLDPRDAGASHNYGWYLCQRQRYADAQVQFQDALAQPQYRDAARTYLARGICLARAGQWRDAEGSLLRSYELDPANPNTGLNLADVLLRRGDATRARFYIGRVNAQPATANAQSLWLAARIEHKLGDLGAVRELGRQLRQRFPEAAELTLLDQGRFDE